MFQYVPKLYDKDTISFIDNNLKVCHTNRVSYYTYIFNFTVLFFFTLIVSITLYTLSNYKESSYEKKEKILKDQDYVLSKIRYYKDNVKQNKSLITDLPTIPINNLPYL
jgi:hypothetical protein